MNRFLKPITSSMLALSIAFGAATMPVKKAEAGVIVAAAASTVALPVGLAIAGMFGGFGASVFSIYWAIDHREKSWYAYGLFMLDQHLDNEQVNMIISERYPDLDSYLVEELAALIRTKSQSQKFNANGYQEIILSEDEIAPVLMIVSQEHPELAEQLRIDFTQKSFN